MRFAAVCFLVLSILIAATVIAALLFNPSRRDPSFILQVVFVFGGLAVWSAIAAWRLKVSENAWPAYALIGFLTMMIAIGWAQYGSLQLNEAIHPVLGFLRIITGLYVLFLWPVLVYASTTSKRAY